MTDARIALIGGDDDFGGTLCRLLRDSGYEVETFAVDAVDVRDAARFGEFDLVVAADILADRVDDADFVRFAVSANGFLFYETGRASGAATDLPASYLARSTSLEDLVSAVSDAVWQRAALSGRQGRSTPRVRTDIEVAYECGGEVRSSRIVSISADGVFIRTMIPPPRGTTVGLAFTLPGAGARIEAVGRILYAIECDIERGIISRPGEGARRIVALPGVGVLFEKMPEVSRNAVRRFVEHLRIFG